MYYFNNKVKILIKKLVYGDNIICIIAEYFYRRPLNSFRFNFFYFKRPSKNLFSIFLLITIRSISVLAAPFFLQAAIAEPSIKSGQSLPLAGVNIAGAEFGSIAVASEPGGATGVHETDYHYPSAAELKDVQAQGFTMIRLPFLWERLEPVLGAPFNSQEQAMLENTVAHARKLGLSVILDPHNYGRWRGALIGSQAVPVTAFADFWLRLAKIFPNQPDILFGLMNEPHGISAKDWAGAAQAAIMAIRGTGAQNRILIPGTNWTGAHSWDADDNGSSNARAMADIKDSGPHAFEFHQYLDSDWSGTSASCQNPQEVVAGLAVATRWLRAQKQKGFLGEFGAGENKKCLEGLSAILSHVVDNRDVWMGWAYWAAGAWWPKDYILSIEPLAGPSRPQMTVLKKAMASSKENMQ